MKWSIRDLLSSRQEKLSWGLTFHWGGGELILAAILIFGILSLGSGMFGKWFSAARDIGLLPVTLHSLGEADYSVDEFLRSVPVIGLDIIKDLLGINEPPETGGAAGIALITPGSSTPTPTSPFSGFLPGTATATGENPDSATATHNPPATATSSLGRTATPTPLWTAQATPSPTWTYSPPLLTNTPMPSTTPWINPSSTPLPTQIQPTATAPIQATNTPLPAPTNTSFPSPTSPPESTPIPKPTRSLTQVLTPTAEYTILP